MHIFVKNLCGVKVALSSFPSVDKHSGRINQGITSENGFPQIEV